MSTLKQLLTEKLTANARNIAALIAICLAAYGLTMLHWLETNQQRDVQLHPREEAPDFLVTNARYLDFKSKKSEQQHSESAQLQTQGLLHLDIQSKTLSHFTDTKTTIFQKPVAQFLDKNNETWVITSDTATAQSHTASDNPNDLPSETIQLQDNVHLTTLSQKVISLDSDTITIDTMNETLKTSTGINMDFEGGRLTAGSFKTSIKTGKIYFNEGVQATYDPKGSNPR